MPLFYVVRCYEYRGICRIGNPAVHSRKKILFLTLRYRLRRCNLQGIVPPTTEYTATSKSITPNDTLYVLKHAKWRRWKLRSEGTKKACNHWIAGFWTGASSGARTLVRSLKPSKERRFSDIIPSIPQTFLKKPCSHVNTYTYSVGSTFTLFSYEAAFAFLLWVASIYISEYIYQELWNSKIRS